MNRLKQVLYGIYQRNWLLVFLVLFFSFILRAYVLHLPGPNPDELLFAFQAERLRVGDPVWAATFRIAGHSLPAGLDGYQGAFPIYIHWLISQLTDYPFRFRAINILYALAAIGFSYFFVRGFISDFAALLSAIFLATLPSLVFYSRIGESAIFLRVMLASAALYCFYRWSAERRWGAFYAGCLALGLGISTRLEIMWWVVAILAYLVLVDRGQLRRVVSACWSEKGKTFIGAACLFLGSSLFIAYNVITHGGTFTQITQNLVFTYAGHSNVELFANLSTRVRHLMELLDGSVILGMSSSYRNYLFSFAFGFAFLSVFVVAVAARLRRQPQREVEFLLFMLAFMLFESMFSVSTLNHMHILILMPIPILILVKFLDLIPCRAVATLIAAGLVASNLWVNTRYYGSLLQVGGRGIFSTRVYGFVEELQQLGISKLIACDWGLARQVYYFSRGRIKVEEIFGYNDDVPASFYHALAATLQEPNNSFLFLAPSYSVFKRQEAFLGYLRERGLAYEEWVFYDNYGPIYILYKVPRNDRLARSR